MNNELESALNEFYNECEEILQRVSESFGLLEKNPDQVPNKIDQLYRDIHTVKGTSQLFGFQNVGLIAHAMEASLEPIRSKGMALTSVMVDDYLKAIDLIEKTLNQSKSSGAENGIDIDKMNSVILKMMEYPLVAAQGNLVVYQSHLPFRVFGEFASLAEESKNDWADVQVKQGNTAEKKQTPLKFDTGKTTQKTETVTVFPSEAGKGNAKSNDKSKGEPILKIAENKTAKDAESLLTEKISEVLQASKEAIVHQQTSGVTMSSDINQEAAKTDEGSQLQDANTTIRVQVNLLDRLMNLVGELVLVRNQVLQFAKSNEDYQFLNMSQRLDVVTSELQEEVMKTRMQPIGSVISKFSRTVRDLSRDLSKKIDFEIIGAETELDKTLIEAIKDPLTHIVRNSCDHGIETPEVRKKAKKSETGTIKINAHQESGQVIVDISDDGKGLDAQKLIEKAIEKGVITAEKARTMPEQEAFHLIFAPGFSTAEKVSSVSGRGVGMDVVRTNIEKIGGNVELQSEKGKGTMIRLKIPLTLAIVPALIISDKNERFAIPQIKLLELVGIENTDEQGNSKLEESIEYVQGNPVFRLRGSILPLISLKQILGEPTENLNKIERVNIAVLSSDGGIFGLVVDEILDTADIVVKPMAKFFKKLKVFSGATIMGDGSVSLILDVAGIAERANIIKDVSEDQMRSSLSMNKSSKVKSIEEQEYLSFSLNSSGTYAVPLGLINRLEEFNKEDIEFSAGSRVVSYRESVLPILSLNECLGFGKDVNSAPKISVLVVQRGDRAVGIQVNEIVDIFTGNTKIENPIKEVVGLYGNIIVDENIITIVDILSILDVLFGKVKKEVSEKKVAGKASKPKKILLVEDTSFFMKQIFNLLEADGHEVTKAHDGEEGWKAVESAKSGDFDLIISDIEMPKINGFELAKKVRSLNNFKNIPMIAVTTRFTKADQEHGMKSGFNYYLEKLKKDELLSTINGIGA